MKRFELKANEENVKLTMRNNWIGRNAEIKNFLQLLDCLEDNTSIALDAEWGSGKTFFIKQVEKVLYTKYQEAFGQNYDDVELTNIIFQDPNLKSIQMNHTYLSVYYDAWLYDDHKEPVLSLLYVLAKTFGNTKDMTVQSGILKKISAIADCLNFWTNGSIVSAKEVLDGKNVLEEIETLESVKSLVSEVIDSLITEKADRLVIFLDELDRCRPDYTITMLERIKHFYDDERVIFIYSINRNQLIQTVKNCYGIGFDASGYLNKFFQLTVRLMPVNMSEYINYLGGINHSDYFFAELALELNNYFRFSLRDSSLYVQEIGRIENGLATADDRTFYIALFVPIVLALRLHNTEVSNKFECGKGFDTLKQLIDDIPLIKDFLKNIFKVTPANEATIDIYNIIKDIYCYLFNPNAREYHGKSQISYNTKNKLQTIINNLKSFSD